MKKITRTILLFLISICVILIFSESTSPIYSNIDMIDSAIFQIIGKSITQGYVPYKDLFDHKGPILFFIQALGIIINEKIGIFILQIINYFIFLLFTSKMINIFTKKRWIRIITLLTTIFASINFLWEGNSPEEWSLALISIELYIICNRLLLEKTHKKDYFISGIVFSLISLIRLNNAAVVVGFMIFSFLYNLREKNIKELFNIILYFIFGCLIIYIPILIYFYKNNAVYEMFYATFMFNFLYALNESAFTFEMIVTKVIGNFPMIFLLILIKKSFYNQSFKKCFYSIIFWNIIAISVGYTYIHYYIIIVPLLTILIVLLLENLKNIKIRKVWDIIKIYIILITFLMYLMCFINNVFNEDNKINSEILNSLNEIKNIINGEKILCYDIPPIVYLLLNKNPSYKYFITQSWHSKYDKQINVEIYKMLKEGYVKYILTNKNIKEEWTKRYELIYTNELYCLYQLK